MSAQGSGKRKSPSLGVDLVESDPEHDDDLDILVESTDSISDLRASCGSSERTPSASEDNEILDYDSVSSPGGSSTASGPIYIRPPGFDHHAHEITCGSEKGGGTQRNGSGSSAVGVTRSNSVLSRHAFTSSGGVVVKKKKGLLSADFKGADALGSGGVLGKKKIEGVAILPTRQKSRKEPLPMKQRALPQSFWQQPNNANPQPPGIVCAALPPLPLGGDDMGDMTPVEEVTHGFFAMNSPSSANSFTPRDYVSSTSQEGAPGAPTGLPNSPMASSTSSSLKRGERVISAANTDLLFSLFNSVEEEETQRRIHVVRRGRPKKSTTNGSHVPLAKVAREDDPCLNSVNVESILPLLPDRGASSHHSSSGPGSNGSTSSTAFKGSQGTQVIRIMSISSGDRSVELPSLNVEHNYPHLLSELVMKL
ncbi:hypothetical protein TCAL_08923 [Tigriopus californicus]|uniref:Uncharacterized protein n=1 Tax=Tigriopus californicus TaxID=6832 RepID=A0A553PP67_TIGCA|nr:uncharacterized protein LOC131882321 [Tigriopus californicus]XP_059085418.1 uncharacterized protein LOC131882321 [Tigriopus californicus]TRY79469.1 hypothetical protein TCAL_08923 [Tigriopus californicus]